MVSETTAFHGFDLIFILSLTLLSNRQDSPRQLYASDKQIQIRRNFSSSTQVSFVSLSMEFGSWTRNPKKGRAFLRFQALLVHRRFMVMFIFKPQFNLFAQIQSCFWSSDEDREETRLGKAKLVYWWSWSSYLKRIMTFQTELVVSPSHISCFFSL